MLLIFDFLEGNEMSSADIAFINTCKDIIENGVFVPFRRVEEVCYVLLQGDL